MAAGGLGGGVANGETAVARRAVALATAAARPCLERSADDAFLGDDPVISSAGVTSNEGLRTSVSGGAMRTPRNDRTSSALRSSIGMASPSGVARSTELVGAQT